MKRNMTVLFGVTQFFYWIGFAVIMAFASLYLLSLGTSNAMVGSIIAFGGLASAILQPVFGTISDRYPALSCKRVLFALAMVLVIIALLLFLDRGNHILLVCFAYGCAIMILQLMQPFVNTLGMKCVNSGYGLNFGVSRAAGSVGYALCAYLLGQLAGRFGAGIIPLCIGGGLLIFLISLLFYPDFQNASDDKKNKMTSEDRVEDAAAGEKTEPKRGSENFFLTYKNFSLVLLGLIPIYLSHTLLNSFTLQIIESKGGGSPEMGTATALAAMLELCVMLTFAWIMKKVALNRLIQISALFFMLKTVGSLLAPNIMTYYGVQFFQMFGWAIMSVGLVIYVNEIMAPEDCAKGQAYATMTYTIGSVIGAWIGGWLLDSAGVSMMLIVGTAIAAIGVVTIWFGSRTTVNIE